MCGDKKNPSNHAGNPHIKFEIWELETESSSEKPFLINFGASGSIFMRACAQDGNLPEIW